MSLLFLLEGLGCQYNQITTLDLGKNLALERLYCDGSGITTLDLSNNQELSLLSLMDMPALTEVCVWTMPFPPEGVTVDTTGSPSAYFTITCSQ